MELYTRTADRKSWFEEPPRRRYKSLGQEPEPRSWTRTYYTTPSGQPIPPQHMSYGDVKPNISTISSSTSKPLAWGPSYVEEGIEVLYNKSATSTAARKMEEVMVRDGPTQTEALTRYTKIMEDNGKTVAMLQAINMENATSIEKLQERNLTLEYELTRARKAIHELQTRRLSDMEIHFGTSGKTIWELEDGLNLANETIKKLKEDGQNFEGAVTSATRKLMLKNEELEDRNQELSERMRKMVGSSDESLARVTALLDAKVAQYTEQEQILSQKVSLIKRLQFQLEGSGQEEDARSRQVAALQKELEHSQREFDQMREVHMDTIRKARMELADAQERGDENVAELEHLRSTKNRQAQQLQALTAEVDQLRSELEASTSTKNRQAQQLQALTAEVEQLRSELEASTSGTYAQESMKRDMHDLKHGKAKLTKKLSLAEETLAERDRTIDALRTAKANSDKMLQSTAKELNEMAGELDSLRTENKNITSKLDAKTQEMEFIWKVHKDKCSDLAVAECELTKLETTLNDERSRSHSDQETKTLESEGMVQQLALKNIRITELEKSLSEASQSGSVAVGLKSIDSELSSISRQIGSFLAYDAKKIRDIENKASVTKFLKHSSDIIQKIRGILTSTIQVAEVGMTQSPASMTQSPATPKRQENRPSALSGSFNSSPRNLNNESMNSIISTPPGSLGNPDIPISPSPRERGESVRSAVSVGSAASTVSDQGTPSRLSLKSKTSLLNMSRTRAESQGRVDESTGSIGVFSSMSPTRQRAQSAQSPRHGDSSILSMSPGGHPYFGAF